MATASLTLSADETLIRQLDEMAAEQHTDLQTMLLRYLEALAAVRTRPLDVESLPPNTRQALGLLKGLPDRPYKELLIEALEEKYGRKS